MTKLNENQLLAQKNFYNSVEIFAIQTEFMQIHFPTNYNDEYSHKHSLEHTLISIK